MSYKPPINVIIAGVGGQGNILASRLIASTAIRKGYHAIVGETFGAAQRGGPVMSHIRISKERLGPLIPYRKAHIILGFEPVETLRVGSRYLNPESSVIMNVRPVYPVDVLTRSQKYPKINDVVGTMKRLSRKFWKLDALNLAIKAGSPIVMNVVMVGALAGSGLTPLKIEDYRETIEKEITRYKDVNLKAFELGLKELKEG